MVEWQGVIREISIRKSPVSDRIHGFIIKTSMGKNLQEVTCFAWRSRVHTPNGYSYRPIGCICSMKLMEQITRRKMTVFNFCRKQ